MTEDRERPLPIPRRVLLIFFPKAHIDVAEKRVAVDPENAIAEVL